jgi:general secretion pathway protein G
MQRGFTLIELMVTIVILGGLIAIVGPNVFRIHGDADRDTARMQMAGFGGAVKLWALRHRTLPDRLEQLIETDPGTGEALLETLPPDPWGSPYEYERLGPTRFRIVSLGLDRLQGTDDDLEWPGAVPAPSR